MIYPLNEADDSYKNVFYKKTVSTPWSLRDSAAPQQITVKRCYQKEMGPPFLLIVMMV